MNLGRRVSTICAAREDMKNTHRSYGREEQVRTWFAVSPNKGFVVSGG